MEANAKRPVGTGLPEPIALDDAWQRLASHLPPRRVEVVPLETAQGRVLAEPIHAPEPSPRFTNSAMDGFALQSRDVAAASPENPAVLTVVGESQAGVPFAARMESGQAVRISTGAKLPEGADAVVPVEEVKVQQGRIQIQSPVTEHQHVRFAGEEFNEGDLLLEAASELTPPRLGLLASVGVHRVTVFRRPRVAVLVTGSELVPAGQPLGEGQIRDSNSLMLAAGVQRCGGEVIRIDRVPDDAAATEQRLQTAENQADLVIFSGGVSVGPHDHVKPAALNSGYQTLFWRVNIKPGKPIFAARKGARLLFGLPGNPVSAYVCFSYFIVPVLRYLQGFPLVHQTVQAVLARPVKNPLSRDHLMRVQLNGNREQGVPAVVPLSRQGSHMLTTLTQADGFIRLSAGGQFEAGEQVTVFQFP